MKQNSYSTTVIHSIDDSFIKQWKGLWEKSENATAFNSYEWFTMHVEAYKIKKYEIYACFNKKKLVAILPLYHTKRFGISVKSVMGDICDTPFLMEKYDKNLLRDFFTRITRDGNLYLMKVDEKATMLLHEMFPEMFYPLMSVNPYILIESDPLRYLPSSAKADIRKILRRNEGQLKFELYTGRKSLEKNLPIVFSIAEKSAKKLNSRDIFSKKEKREYFQHFVTYLSKFVRIGVLYYQNTPIVSAFGFITNHLFWGYYISYLYDYRKLSPGKLMIVELLQECVDSSITHFDLGGGISNYKQQFTPTYRCLYDIYYSPNPLFMWVWKTINFARRMKQRLLPEKYTRDHEFLFKDFINIFAK